jgi:pentatricopeptide repeat domain-containing protein 1
LIMSHSESIVDALVPFIPEMLGAACFTLGLLLMSKTKPKVPAANLMKTDYEHTTQVMEACDDEPAVQAQSKVFSTQSTKCSALLARSAENHSEARGYVVKSSETPVQTTTKPSLITFNSLIDACVRTNNLTEAWNYLDAMKAQGCTPDNFTYSALVRGIRNEGEGADLDRAFSLLEELEQWTLPDEVLYNCLLDACVEAKQLDKALSLFEKMQISPQKPSSTELSSGVRPSGHHKPDEISYNTLIKGCSQMKQLDRAIGLLQQMKSAGLRPNEVTYNSIIDACVRAGKMTVAWQYLTEMQEDGVIPDNFTYSTLVKGIRNEQSADELSRVFALLDTHQLKPDEILYNCLIDACVRLGDITRAVDIFRRMEASPVEPSSVTFGILIKAYGQCSMLSKAFETFEEMKRRNLKPNDVTFGCLLDACVRAGEVEMAQEVFTNMQVEGIALNTILYTTMIKGFSKTLNLPKALGVFEAMKKDASVEPNNVTYNSLLDCAVRCEDMATASKLFQEMKERMQPDLISYSTIIKGCCRGGDLKKAMEVLNDMKRNHIKPDEVLFNSLLDGCAKNGSLEMAQHVYQEMRLLGIKPSNVTFSILIKAYGKARQVQKALEILEEMRVEGVAPGMIVYTCLLQTCIRSKQIHRALVVYEDMKRSNVKGDRVTFNTIVNGCVYAKQLEAAYKITLDAFSLNVRLAEDVYSNLLRSLSCSHDAATTEWAATISRRMRERGMEPEASSARTAENRSFTQPKKGPVGRRPVLGERSYNC